MTVVVKGKGELGAFQDHPPLIDLVDALPHRRQLGVNFGLTSEQRHYKPLRTPFRPQQF